MSVGGVNGLPFPKELGLVQKYSTEPKKAGGQVNKIKVKF